MASLRREDGARKGWRVTFRLARTRSSIWLGAINEDSAKQFVKHLEYLVSLADSGDPPAKSTVQWLKSIPDSLHAKLAKTGLVAPRNDPMSASRITLIKWIDSYVEGRADIKTSTRKTLKRARDSAAKYFGASKLLRDVTSADANAFLAWLKLQGNRRNRKQGTVGVSDNTARRTVGRMKQFFGAAIRQGLLTENPFELLRSAVNENEENFHFVDSKIIEDCVAKATNLDWKVLLGLARYGGLRVPSELSQMKWSDIDMVKKRMTVRATKTAHHKGGGVRTCPIFPELFPYFELAFQNRIDGCEYVIRDPRYRSAEANLRTRFCKLLAATGHEPWPNLFQNLRKSRVTEVLAQGHSMKSVAKWFGHSAQVMLKHYAMARDEDFDIAAGLKPKNGGDIRGDNRANP